MSWMMVLAAVAYLSVGFAVVLVDVKVEGFDDEVAYFLIVILWPMVLAALLVCGLIWGLNHILKKWEERNK